MGRLANIRLASRPPHGSALALPPPDAPAVAGRVEAWDWQVDADGVFLYCGPNTEPMVGFRPQELVGRPANLVMDTGELVRSEAVLAAIDGHANGWSGLLVQGRHRSGSTVWFEVAGRPVRDIGGLVIGYRGSSRPLTLESGSARADRLALRRIESVLNDRLLTIHFQPIVELSGGTVVGVEALSRFPGPSVQPPDVWFAEAATVGLGVELELLAVRSALVAAQALPDHLYVSINASPQACLDPRLATLLEGSRLRMNRLVIELTEHSQVRDYRALDEALGGLRSSGVRLAVDDVGAGFSSLQHILQVRPGLIKLDRSVVARLDIDRGRQALGAAIVSFADRIGARVIAEGIETVPELRAAAELGMSAVQGFLLGAPTDDRTRWRGWRPETVVAPQSMLGPVQRPAPTDPRRPTGSAADTRQDGTGSHDGTGGQDRTGRHNGADRRDGAFGDVAAEVFDALPDATAVLDGAGAVIATNRAWQSFAVAGDSVPARCRIGVDYLEVFRDTAAQGRTGPAEAAAGLQAVLQGRLAESSWEYSCPTTDGPRWFRCRVTALGAGRGAIATHLELSLGRHGAA